MPDAHVRQLDIQGPDEAICHPLCSTARDCLAEYARKVDIVETNEKDRTKIWNNKMAIECSFATGDQVLVLNQ